MSNAKRGRRAPQHRMNSGRHREPARTMSDLTVAPATAGAKIAAVGVIGTASALAAPAAAFAGTGDGPGGAAPTAVNVAPAPVGFGYRVCAFYCAQGGYTYTPDGGLALQIGGGFGTPQAGPIINYKPFSSAIGLEGGAQIPGVSIAGGVNTSSGLYVNGKSPVGNFNWSDNGGTTVNYGIYPTGLTQLGSNAKLGAQGLLLGSLNMGDLAKWWNNVTGANPPSDKPVQTGDGMWSYPPGYQPPPAHLTDWSDAFGPGELKQQPPQSSGQQQNGPGGQQDNGVPQAGQQGSSGPQGTGEQGNGGPQSGAAQNGGPQNGAQPGDNGQQGGAQPGGTGQPSGAQPGDGSQPGGATTGTPQSGAGTPQGGTPQDSSQGGAPQGGAPQGGQPPATAGQPADGTSQPADGQPPSGPAAGTPDPAAPPSAPPRPPWRPRCLRQLVRRTRSARRLPSVVLRSTWVPGRRSPARP